MPASMLESIGLSCSTNGFKKEIVPRIKIIVRKKTQAQNILKDLYQFLSHLIAYLLKQDL